jgi:hypothetical protein
MLMVAETRFWTSREGRKGFLAGLAGPWIILGFLAMYRFQTGSEGDFGESDGSVASEWWNLLWMSGLFGPVLSLAVLPNLALFWWNLHRQSEQGAGGVLMATFVYALVVVAVKWIF